MGKVSESIFSGKSTIIPMADVQHIEKQFYKNDFAGISIITKHTRWDMEADIWANNIYLPKEEAEKFIKAWCFYRHELEGNIRQIL